MTSEPNTGDHTPEQPDAGTREVLEEAEEATDLPRGATPDTPQRRSSAEQLDDAEAEAARRQGGD